MSAALSEAVQALRDVSVLWSRQAQVMHAGELEELRFDPAKDDFLEELLPFGGHPDLQSIPEGLKTSVLSYGWLIYQQKTIQIETKIITPACIDIIDRQVPGVAMAELRQSISETLTDEAYHTLLAVRTCQVVMDERALCDGFLEDFALTTEVTRFVKSQTSDWRRRLARMAVACCSECLITDYLSKLSGNGTVQPLLSRAVQAHAADEWVHSHIFSTLAAALYPRLGSEAAALFRTALARTAAWFFDPEIDVWRDVLVRLDQPGLSRIIADLSAVPRTAPAPASLPRGIQELCARLGVADTDLGLESCSTS